MSESRKTDMSKNKLTWTEKDGGIGCRVSLEPFRIIKRELCEKIPGGEGA